MVQSAAECCPHESLHRRSNEGLPPAPHPLRTVHRVSSLEPGCPRLNRRSVTPARRLADSQRGACSIATRTSLTVTGPIESAWPDWSSRGIRAAPGHSSRIAMLQPSAPADAIWTEPYVKHLPEQSATAHHRHNLRRIHPIHQLGPPHAAPQNQPQAVGQGLLVESHPLDERLGHAVGGAFGG